MSNKDTNTELKETEMDTKNQPLNARRSLLKKVGVAAPVVVTLASRPAYGAGFCSLSGFASMNASGVLRHQNQNCGGYSYGGWKTAYGNGDGNWATENVGVIPNPQEENYSNLKELSAALERYENDTDSCRVPPAPSGSKPVERCVDIMQIRTDFGTTLFSEVFNRAPVARAGQAWPTAANYQVSLHDGLLYGNAVTREAVAAYLNAKAASRTNFHFTPAEVQELFDTGRTMVGGSYIPSTGTLSDADFIALFQGAQH